MHFPNSSNENLTGKYNQALTCFSGDRDDNVNDTDLDHYTQDLAQHHTDDHIEPDEL